jgi:hypothetical protein
VEAEKKKIRQEYEFKEKQVDVRKKMGITPQLSLSQTCLLLLLSSPD